MTESLVGIRPSGIPVGGTYRSSIRPISITFLTPIVMRRIKDNRENETLENALEAFENYACQKHKRWNVMRYEMDIDANTHQVLRDIIEESFRPSGYSEKWIFDKKPRKLAKAPVRDHHTEAAAMLPYERQVYDYISWRAPAVRPGMANEKFFRTK